MNISIRRDDEISDTEGGWFRARWHFSFDTYRDPEYMGFGNQRMTLGSGEWHSEQNGSQTEPMRFIQMWIMPDERGLTPGVEQKAFTTEDRTGKLLKVIAPEDGEAVKVHGDATVYVSRLPAGKSAKLEVAEDRGVYLYVIEGDVTVNGEGMETGAAARIWDERAVDIAAAADSELILVDVDLTWGRR